MMPDKMINFPNCKINLGLNIVGKRPDGYHNIETIFYPIRFFDALEILPAEEFSFVNKGIQIDCEIEDNLCYKAYKMLKDEFNLPPVKIVLCKRVPFGSGLGAGSANAAFVLTMLNEMFELNLSEVQLQKYASTLGADCAFFIKNHPCLAVGKGDEFSDIELNLSGYYLALCTPKIAVSTKLAYKNCIISQPETELSDIIKRPIGEWKHYLKNDFEKSVFAEIPELAQIKQNMYNHGAIYASMSGSGSAIYGIFDHKPDFSEKDCFIVEL